MLHSYSDEFSFQKFDLFGREKLYNASLKKSILLLLLFILLLCWRRINKYLRRVNYYYYYKKSEEWLMMVKNLFFIHSAISIYSSLVFIFILSFFHSFLASPRFFLILWVFFFFPKWCFRFDQDRFESETWASFIHFIYESKRKKWNEKFIKIFGKSTENNNWKQH